jgi:biotin-dependent carboxylase-like uncharacterized protein
MTARLTVLEPGLHTTVQDFGRFGFQALGVPTAGALDPVGLRLANALAGNRPGEAGLEICHAGPRLLVEGGADGGPVRVAVAGAARLSIHRGGEARPAEAGRTHRLEPGDELAIGAVTDGATAYLAVEGGFALDPVMGSLSTYCRAAIGPLGGRPLFAGAILPLRQPCCADGAERRLGRPMDYGAGPVRVILGPQHDAFTDGAVATLLSAAYRVGREADRMGLRLEGPPLAHRAGADIPSDGLVPGCIQVPGGGAPIVLLADHQTVGGYAKIATAISADLPRLGRLAPGAAVSFAAVTIAEAEAARRRLEEEIRRTIAAIVPISGGGVDLDALYGAELISGMVDAPSGLGR